MNSRSETGFPTMEEGGTRRIPNGPSNYRPWSRQKDPRIVRVSPSFGGKDRHSKVCTVRGLRDRRVRLSVQTAIQLYDLQDRLGLSQPSKVVDWLLTVAQHDIDKLPPLQMPVENFVYAQSMVVSNGNVGNVAAEDQASLGKPARWNSDATLRAKCKEVERETMSDQKSTWIKRNDGKSHQGPEFHGTQVITPLNNVVLHGACYYQWESPSFHVNPI